MNILAHNLAEPAYEADVAQLEYKLVAGEHGLMIRLKGFNHKLPVRTHTDTQTHTFGMKVIPALHEPAESALAALTVSAFIFFILKTKDCRKCPADEQVLI